MRMVTVYLPDSPAAPRFIVWMIGVILIFYWIRQR